MKKIDQMTSENIEQIKSSFFDTGPVAIATDTNYNLACDPFNHEHVDLIFKYKERKKDKPLSIFLYNPYDIKKYATNFNEKIFDVIASSFLPGPLNIVLDKATWSALDLTDTY